MAWLAKNRAALKRAVRPMLRRAGPWIATAILAMAAALPTALLAAPPDAECGVPAPSLLQPRTVLDVLARADEDGAAAERVYAQPSLPPIDEDVMLVSDEVVQAPPAPPRPNVPGPARPPAQNQPAPPAAAVAPDQAAPPAAPPSNFLSSSIGAASSPQSTAPFMIGDAFGGNDVVIRGLPGAQGFGPVSGGSLNVTGRLALAENFSPMPRDRVFFDYNDFQDVPLVANNTVSNLNRYSPGFEKTFFDRWASIEVRIPVATTLNTTISGIGPNNTHQGEFGDLFVSLKTLLVQTDRLAISGGMALALPTANSITLVNYPTVSLNQLQIQNRAVYFQPYLASLWTPNNRFYTQALVSTEVASGGSGVSIAFTGLPTQFLGRLNNQTLLDLSIAAGYWVYRNPRGRYLTGVSPLFELHQTQTVSGSNLVGTTSNRGDNVTVGQLGYQFQLLNMTTGVNMQLGPLSSLLLGYCTPLGSGSDKAFAGEFRVLFNRRFGPQNRQTLPQF